MQQIQLRVPKAIHTLVRDEQDRLLRSALRVAARQRARELAAEQREASANIRRYERKYGMSLAEFEHEKLPGLDSVQAHEDYNDWFFWTRVLDRAGKTADVLKKMETVK
jgi:hypothetical protein